MPHRHHPLGWRPRAILSVLILLVHMSAASAQRDKGTDVARDPRFIEPLVSHGPWPQPRERDSTNDQSGKAVAIELGRRLFFDARLSPSGRVACSSCHRPERAWSDGRRVGVGLAPGQRNTPSLLDVRLHRRFGWAGDRNSLWQQSIRPLLDPAEMGSSAEHLREYIAREEKLSAMLASAAGLDARSAEAERILEAIARALAAYQETIESPRTPFDDFRDVLTRSDGQAASRYPAAAKRGASLFVGSAGCARCHAGPTFSDGALHPARHGGALKSVRTPGLRHVTATAPYLHDGSAPTLRAAIRTHAGGERLPSRALDDLVAFLRTLSPRR